MNSPLPFLREGRFIANQWPGTTCDRALRMPMATKFRQQYNIFPGDLSKNRRASSTLLSCMLFSKIVCLEFAIPAIYIYNYIYICRKGFELFNARPSLYCICCKHSQGKRWRLTFIHFTFRQCSPCSPTFAFTYSQTRFIHWQLKLSNETRLLRWKTTFSWARWLFRVIQGLCRASEVWIFCKCLGVWLAFWGWRLTTATLDSC